MTRALTWLKEFCKDFPHQGGLSVVTVFLVLETGVLISIRLALGKEFPIGYDTYFVFLGSLAGIATGGMIGKRATDFRHKSGGTEPPPTDEVKP